MKTVFSTSFEVAHIFANKSQKIARSSNTSISTGWNKDLKDSEVRYFYSYSTVIAEHIKNSKGETAVMLNDIRYSNTTSKHQYEVRSACSHLKRFYSSKTYIKHVYARISELIENLVPKVKSKKQEYLNEASELLLSYETFKEWEGTKGWKKDVQYIKSVKLVRIGDDFGLLAKYTAAEKRELARKERARVIAENERKAKAIAEYQIELGEWIRGERGRVPYKPSFDLEDFIRVSKDGKFVQTTQGVSIPVDSARVLYKMIIAGKDIAGYDIEGYTVKGLNGVLTIGCHRINVENMHSVGKSLLD